MMEAFTVDNGEEFDPMQATVESLLPSAGKVMGFESKTAAKQQAQEILMHSIATALGYWEEEEALLAERMSPEDRAQFSALMKQQADRVAKMFGYEEAWLA